MRVRIKETRVDQREVTAKATGKKYVFRTQVGWVELDGEVRRIEVQLDDGQLAYEAGIYVVGDGSFRIDNYGRLSLGRLALARDAAAQPVPQARAV